MEVSGQVFSHDLTGLTGLGCRGPVVDTETSTHCVLLLLTFYCPFDFTVLQLKFSPSSNKYTKKCLNSISTSASLQQCNLSQRSLQGCCSIMSFLGLSACQDWVHLYSHKSKIWKKIQNERDNVWMISPMPPSCLCLCSLLCSPLFPPLYLLSCLSLGATCCWMKSHCLPLPGCLLDLIPLNII